MEFREVMRRRRMHRAFLPEPLPEEQISRIAGVIRHSLSAGFGQGGTLGQLVSYTSAMAFVKKAAG